MSGTKSSVDVRPKQFAAKPYARNMNGLPSSSTAPVSDAGTGTSCSSDVDTTHCTGSLHDTSLSSSRGLHRTFSAGSEAKDSDTSLHKAFIQSTPSIPSRGKQYGLCGNASLLSGKKGSLTKDSKHGKKLEENIEMLEEFDASGPLLSSSKKNLCEGSHTNTPTTTSLQTKPSKLPGGTLVLNDDEYSQYVQLSQEMVLEHQVKVKNPFQKGKVVFISGREVVLAIGMFFSLTLALGLIFTIAREKMFTEKDKVIQPDSGCPAKKCVSLPQFIKNMTDFSQDPCEDFFAYACSGWLKTNQIPPNKKSWDVTDVLAARVNERVKSLLEMADQKHDPGSALWKVRTMYSQCMDNEHINGSEPLQELLAKTHGWQPSELPLGESLKVLQWRYRVAAFFNVWVAPDDKDNTRMIIQFDEGGLNLGKREDYFKDPASEKVQAYMNYMEQFSNSLNSSPRNFTQTTFEFEKKLAKIHLKEEMLEASSPAQYYNKLSVNTLASIAPKIQWLTFLQAAFPEVTGETEVLITSRDYFRQLSELLDQSSLLVLKQYMVWSAVYKHADGLSPALQRLSQQYQEQTTGIASVERWQHCVDVVSQWMGAAVGVLYVQKHVMPNAVNKVQSIVNDLKLSFEATLKNSLWMSSTTKDHALEKLKFLGEVAGYQKHIMEPEYLNRLFHNFSVVKGESLLNSSLNGVQYDLKIMAQQLRTNQYLDSPPTSPHEVSALYTWADNKILIQAGILQPPHFYMENTHRVVNYGALGSIIGHEIVHGFSITGGQFDKDGKLTMWWSDLSSTTFETRTNCIAQQYSDYSQDGVTIDGNLTLVENVADIEGLKMAYKAFQRVNREHQTLFDNLTPEQLFFVTFAQNQCGKSSKEKLNEATMHAPGRVRVHGTLANIDEFSRAFSCKPGSKMNPRNKCSIWD